VAALTQLSQRRADSRHRAASGRGPAPVPPAPVVRDLLSGGHRRLGRCLPCGTSGAGAHPRSATTGGPCSRCAPRTVRPPPV